MKTAIDGWTVLMHSSSIIPCVSIIEVEDSIPYETCFISETQTKRGCILEETYLQMYVQKNVLLYFQPLKMLFIF
jgi:hypothetical protein